MCFTKLTQYLDTLSTVYDMRAVEVSVTHRQQVVFRYANGYSDLDGNAPASTNDYHWLYSMSKPVTCVAAMRLVEEGLLSLDDPVSKYLPEYAQLTVQKGDTVAPAQNTMLIRHLFAMRSGLNYNLGMPSIKESIEKGKISTRQLVAAFAKEPLCFEPGTGYQYSLSHDVLGAVIEVVTGKSFYSYLKETIFDPLGMEHTGFHPTKEQLATFSQQYLHDPYRYTNTPTNPDCAYMLSSQYESGGAGLYSTNEDYLKFVEALAGNGTAKNGYQLLKPETIALMATNQQPEGTPPIKPGYGYGLGVRTLTHPEVCFSLSPLGEFGWDGAACSYCMIDPKNQLGIVLTTQVLNFPAGYSEIHPHVRNLVYQCLKI